MDYRSRAVRSLLELHEAELRAFLATWQRFKDAGLPMPEAHGDEDYASIERLGGHVLIAARQYLVRITEWLGRPAGDLDMANDAAEIVPRAGAFLDSVIGAYRRHLASATDEEITPQVHKTRFGTLLSVELLLEHAVVHPMRHRVQLERILAGTP